MAVRFEEYTPDLRDAVRAFNRRIASAIDDPELAFPEHPLDLWLPKGANPDIYQETFLALDGDVVRGGYVLKHQPFAVNGEIRRVSSYRLPLSEGIVDRAYVSIGLLTLRHALAQQPLLFSLGMGSFERPVAKMQKAAGWSQYLVPFHFRVVHGGNFLRHLAPLRANRARRMVADLAALTGAGSLAFAAIGLARRARVASDVATELVPDFGPWADALWERCRARYALIAVRDQRIANILYPPEHPRFLRWKVTVGNRVAGWAVCLDTPMHAHKQFGDMRVTTIVDCLADPEDAGTVIAAITRELERRGPDMIICNQMHAAWSNALRDAGYFSGPSNFIFSASKKLAESLSPWDQRVMEGHINRGDGDGPVHL
jgi:hypothetical protein